MNYCACAQGNGYKLGHKTELFRWDTCGHRHVRAAADLLKVYFFVKILGPARVIL